MKRSLLSLSALLGVGAASGADQPEDVARLFGSSDNLGIVRTAERVDSCLLRHIPAAELPDGRIDWQTERYEDTTFTVVPAQVAGALRDLLLDNKSYDWKTHGGRRPSLYLRLRFHHGADVVTCDFCFLCRVVLVSRDGAEVNRANFSPSADLFLQQFLKVYPQDEPLRRVAKEAGLPL
ncbi:MAG TPA: hypothetical protein VL200_09050 [Lacunisphaera sp.]|nr:hypothetical protein [Lacunisphaera sp.]